MYANSKIKENFGKKGNSIILPVCKTNFSWMLNFAKCTFFLVVLGFELIGTLPLESLHQFFFVLCIFKTGSQELSPWDWL
jgi:hypothetical protein